MSARFPQGRLRRLRQRPILRDVVRDVHVRADDLVLPLFISADRQARDVGSMPGVAQLPVDEALRRIESWAGDGLRQFILFGVTPAERKDETGSFALDPDAPVNRLLQRVRERGLDVVMYADLCFCEYTEHGHCGVVHESGDAAGGVDNDRTLEMLARAAQVQARCGADVVAPSGMMDGMVGTIRRALDDAGAQHVAILSYAIKFASNFYGPFREAGEGGMKFGDRKGYQMDYRRTREWRSELEADLDEGADMVMVKPAMAYLDILHQVRQSCSVPVAAYHVSGEYAMLHAAAERGAVDLKQAVLETTYAIKRAGADLILTYFAPQLIAWL